MQAQVQTASYSANNVKNTVIAAIRGGVWDSVGVPDEFVQGASSFADQLSCVNRDMDAEEIKEEYFSFRDQVQLSHMDQQIIEGGILPHL